MNFLVYGFGAQRKLKMTLEGGGGAGLLLAPTSNEAVIRKNTILFQCVFKKTLTLTDFLFSKSIDLDINLVHFQSIF